MLGRTVGNYQVMSQIGEGGMGVVYLARHVTLGRPAAVKVLHAALASNQEVVSRFFNEAKAATAVRHAGIVEVFDFGFLEDRSAYLVMEFLEGESLAARLRRGPLAISAALIILRAISRALQAAHEHSIVHRDLKPDNIFLVPDAELPGGERIKLLDFGIAKLTSSIGETSHTRTGAVMGTPTYMAPEQCRGAGSVDHRADLYALGCVAYEMLRGTPPFVADGAGEVIARHLYFQPEPLRTSRADVPAPLDELVLRLLQKDPQARLQSAADVAHAIDRLVMFGFAGAHGEPLAVGGLGQQPRAPFSTTLSGMALSPPSAGRPGISSGRLVAGAAALAAIALVAAMWTRGSRSTDASVSSARVDDTQSIVAASPAPASPVAAVPPTVAVASPQGSASAASPDRAVPLAQAPTAGGGAPALGREVTAPASAAAKPQESTRSQTNAPSERSIAPTRAPSRAASPPVRNADPTASPASAAGESSAPTTSAFKLTSACTRAAFAAVLNADSANEEVVQAALARLRRCKATMASEMYTDIQRQLIGKL